MTSYKFPASLGGGEHKSVGRSGDKYSFHLPGVGGPVWLHISDLTVVTPPIPPEPGPGCHLLRRPGHPDEPILGYGGEWTADGGWQRWEEFWEVYGAPGVTIEGPLVPAPPEVTLPWTSGPFEVKRDDSPDNCPQTCSVVLVHKGTANTVINRGTYGTFLTAGHAEALAYALLAAARQAHNAPTGERAV